jgi:hypothetical protein
MVASLAGCYARHRSVRRRPASDRDRVGQWTRVSEEERTDSNLGSAHARWNDSDLASGSNGGVAVRHG